MLRSIANILAFFSVFFLPPYLTLALLTACILFFESFIESVLYAFLADVLYSSGMIFGASFHYPYTLFIIMVLIFAIRIKKMLKFYPTDRI